MLDVKKSSILALIALVITSTHGYCKGIELHAHLFMKEGMGWLFRGSFNERLQASSWKNRFRSQVNADSLQASQLDIVVVTLYAHPFLTFSMRDSVRSQIALAKQFVETHSNWVIVRSPSEALDALHEKKHVLILALEGASGILESEQDIREFIVENGIRIVSPLHLTDDELGGVAFLKGLRALSSPIAFLKNLIHPTFDLDGNRVNPNGLSEKGKMLIKQLIQHHVWIDLAHSSDTAQKEIISILERSHIPLLYTHTVLRKYHQSERAISNEQLYKVAESKGYIGLMPSEEMLEGTPVIDECAGTIFAFAKQFQDAAQVVGKDAIGVGSDFNGGIPHLKPSCRPTGTSLDEKGLWNIGQSTEIWNALEKLGVWKEETDSDLFLSHQAQNFLSAWSHVWSNSE